MTLVRKYFAQGMILSLILGGVFTLLGVYNTSQLPYFNRFVFWTSTMVVGLFSTGFLAPFVFERLFPKQHVLLKLGTIIFTISIPVTLVLAAFDHNYGTDWSATIWMQQYRHVVVISTIVLLGSYYVLRAQGYIVTPNQDAENIPSLEHQFLKRLPDSFHQAQLYAVASEDHYLRVITSAGESLILMRLSDAIIELSSVEGMQTHRSWWVAKAGVKQAGTEQGKFVLTLKSGDLVPVSRTYQQAVKAAMADLTTC